MTNEQLRMQMLSSIITESEYKAKLEENKKLKSKKSLNENFVGIGAINNPFLEREKTDYEMAFEHFTKGTSLNEKMEDEKDEDYSDYFFDIDTSEEDLEEIALEKTPLDENVGTILDKILQTFEFSQKGNDEMIEFGEYLLSPEGPKNIAMSIKSKLKGEGGEKYFTSDPEKLQAFLSKLR
jgi:phage anti-repressor protein